MKRFDVATGKAAHLTPTTGAHDLVGPIFARDGNETESRLAGVRWRNAQGPSNEWFDAAMAAAERRLCENLPGCRPDWTEQSPANPDEWIVECLFSDQPPVWAVIDISFRTIRILSKFDSGVSRIQRDVYRWRAPDGAEVCGIVSFPRGGGPFPLVVFPHGGPGADTASWSSLPNIRIPTPAACHYSGRSICRRLWDRKSSASTGRPAGLRNTKIRRYSVSSEIHRT